MPMGNPPKPGASAAREKVGARARPARAAALMPRKERREKWVSSKRIADPPISLKSRFGRLHCTGAPRNSPVQSARNTSQHGQAAHATKIGRAPSRRNSSTKALADATFEFVSDFVVLISDFERSSG